MGFFDSFMNAYSGERGTVKMYHEINDDISDYRSIAKENSESENGWYTCARCGRKFRFSQMDADHIVPRSKGGSDTRENLQLLCKHCNRSKGADMSDTREDLRRRKRELEKQDREDVEYLRRIKKR